MYFSDLNDIVLYFLLPAEGLHVYPVFVHNELLIYCLVWDGRAGQAIALSLLFFFIFKLFVQPVTSGSPPYLPLYYWQPSCIVLDISNNVAGPSPAPITNLHYLFPILFMFDLLFVFFHPLTFMPLSYSKGQHSLHILLLLLLFMMEVEPGCVFQSWRKFSLMFTRNIQTVF